MPPPYLDLGMVGGHSVPHQSVGDEIAVNQVHKDPLEEPSQTHGHKEARGSGTDNGHARGRHFEAGLARREDELSEPISGISWRDALVSQGPTAGWRGAL
jgi:hypothetical protein